jgi:acyl-CoA synthetase (AMP-forming)/AMP-acid ligase II
MNVATLPDERAISDPDAPCLSDEHGQLDNTVFASRVRAVAGWLHDQGIRSGDVVAAMLPNRVELATLLFAAWRVGAVLMPLNPALTAEEANYQLADSKSRLTVVDAASIAKIDRSVSLVASVDELSTLGAFNELPPAVAEPDSLALLIYTSGTTGRPKGVMLDHANVSATTEMLIETLRLGPSDRALLILPLFHANGIIVSVVAPLAAGGSAHIAVRFDAQAFWMQIERTRPTYLSAVPSIYARLAALPDGVKPDASSLRFVLCGAAPAPIDELRAFERRYRVPVLEGYGLSEGTVCSTLNPVDGQRKPRTVGLPLPGQEVRIADGEGHFLPAGRTGEIVVRGPNVMRGYLGKPDDTARALQGGWLHTGDVGHFDEGGYLYLVDRVRDLIIRGGENIYPREIESVLHTHPAVLEAVVVGRPDTILGEEPVAFVALRGGRTVEPEDLIEHCRKSLARFKVPRAIYIEASLPKNPMGKLVKGPLRERVRDVA